MKTIDLPAPSALSHMTDSEYTIQAAQARARRRLIAKSRLSPLCGCSLVEATRTFFPPEAPEVSFASKLDGAACRDFVERPDGLTLRSPLQR